MTRQRAGVKRTVHGSPKRRSDPDGFVITLDPQVVTLKPLRARRAEATVSVTWSQIYQWALIARVPPVAKKKRRSRRTRRKAQ